MFNHQSIQNQEAIRRRPDSAAGYRNDQIGLVAKNVTTGKTVRTDGSAGETMAAEGAAIGASQGVAAGACRCRHLAENSPSRTADSAIGNARDRAAKRGWRGLHWLPLRSSRGLGMFEERRQARPEQRQGRYLVTVDCGGRSDRWYHFNKHGGYDRARATRLIEQSLMRRTARAPCLPTRRAPARFFCHQPE